MELILLILPNIVPVNMIIWAIIFSLLATKNLVILQKYECRMTCRGRRLATGAGAYVKKKMLFLVSMMFFFFYPQMVVVNY